MSAQLQPGTLVEFTGTNNETPLGTRAWVLGTHPTPQGYRCYTCGSLFEDGLILTLPTVHQDAISWCPHHWRPYGGDFEEAKRTVEVGV